LASSPSLAANDRGFMQDGYLKNVCPVLMLNKVTKDEDKKYCSFLFCQPEQKLSKVHEADEYYVSPYCIKPNVSGKCQYYGTLKLLQKN
jgi:hypothetical protein